VWVLREEHTGARDACVVGKTLPLRRNSSSRAQTNPGPTNIATPIVAIIVARAARPFRSTAKVYGRRRKLRTGTGFSDPSTWLRRCRSRRALKKRTLLGAKGVGRPNL
jgi:hypothetical protein